MQVAPEPKYPVHFPAVQVTEAAVADVVIQSVVPKHTSPSAANGFGGPHVPTLPLATELSRAEHLRGC